MKTYRFFLFDADGTMFDTGELIYNCFLHTCTRLKQNGPSRQEVLSSMGLPLRKQFEKYMGPIEEGLYSEIQAEYMAYQLKVYKEYLRLFPGIRETLEILKGNGKKLAVVTSRKIQSLTVYLKHTEILELFDALVTPESTLRHKPDAEPALKAMELLGADKKQSIFIGDSVYDIECGSEAGIDTAFVMWSHNDVNTLQTRPTFCIKRISELCNL